MTAAKDIQLNKKALRLLRQIANNRKLDWTIIENSAEYKTLAYYSLVSHSSHTQIGTVTEKGMQVLLHHQCAADDRRQEHWHNWIIAIFSTFGGALLSKPVWDGIGWFIEWIKEII